MLGRLLHRPAFLTGALALLAVPLLWWFAWMGPQGSRLASARATARTEQLEKSSLAAELALLVREQQQVRKSNPFSQRFAAAIPTSSDPAGLLVEVYNLAKTTGVTLDSIADDSVTATKQYSSIPVSISVTGGHAAVNAFVAGLYRLPRLLTVQSLNLSGPSALNATGGGQFSASVTATAYSTASGGSTTRGASS